MNHSAFKRMTVVTDKEWIIHACSCHGMDGALRDEGGPTRHRTSWRMPPLTLLAPVRWSAGTRLGMLALRGYLVIGAVLLIVKAVQLGRG